MCLEFPSRYSRAQSAPEAIEGIEQVIDRGRSPRWSVCGAHAACPLAERRYSGNFTVRSSPSLHARLVVEATEQHVSLNQWVVQKLADRAPTMSPDTGSPKIVGRTRSPSATITCVSTQFDVDQPVHAAGGWRVLAPFRFREYRLLITAVSVSVFATGMWAVVMALQVIAIDDDPAALSLVAACLGVGMVGFVLVGGIAADRFPQRSIIVIVEAVNFVAVATVAVLGVTGSLRLWHMAVTAAALGVGMAFFYPAYSAYLPRILPTEQLLAANGVEGVMRPTLQQAIGPAVAGVLIGATLPTLGAVVVAVLYGIGLALLIATRPVSQQVTPDRPKTTRAGRPARRLRIHAAHAVAAVNAAVRQRLRPAGDRTDRGVAAIHHAGTLRKRRANIRFRARGLWRRRSDRRPGGVIGPTAAPLHDGDDMCGAWATYRWSRSATRRHSR